MTEQALEALLADFMNRLRVDGPLDVSKPEDSQLYVKGLHGDTDAVARLRKEILFMFGQGVFLFTGQPGSGKSTELYRLKRDLVQRGCKVFYVDLADWLNLNAPITLASFLVALLSSWIDQAGVLQGKRSPAQRLIDFFTKTRLIPEGLTLDAAAGPFKSQLRFALQSDDDFRRALDLNLKRQLSSVVAQAHDLVAELKLDLCPNGEHCVLLADSMEKLRGYGDDTGHVYESVQRLFISEGAALKLPGVHVVYSVAPYLLEQNTQLAGSLGTGNIVNMPSVHVFAKASHEPDEPGVAAVLHLLSERYPRWREVFTEAQMRRIVLMTGGDLRDFLRAVRVALTDDISALPVADAVVDYALEHVGPSRNILAEHVRWLARLDASHEAELGGDIDGLVLQRYLATKHVLAYLNGRDWYAVHPMLRDWVAQRAAALPPLDGGAAAAAAQSSSVAPPSTAV